jgi:SAM-dependent methyltransferase
MAGERLTMPAELYEAMGRPPALDLRAPDEQQGRFIKAAGVRSRLTRRLTYRLLDLGESAEYSAVGASEPDREYRIVNYHPAYYLLPAVDHDEFWRKIEDYHEHRPPADQEKNATRVSAWLVDDVLAPLGDSFLELGCGAGRNLDALRAARPDANVAGVEVNEQAAALAGVRAQVTVGSLYEMDLWTGRPVDVVFTSGVLMHVPHNRVAEVVTAAKGIAARAVVHFELHGPSHEFDFHRYPRDYASLYERLGFTVDRYEVFLHKDFRSAALAPFHHALLVSTRR